MYCGLTKLYVPKLRHGFTWIYYVITRVKCRLRINIQKDVTMSHICICKIQQTFRGTVVTFTFSMNLGQGYEIVSFVNA